MKPFCFYSKSLKSLWFSRMNRTNRFLMRLSTGYPQPKSYPQVIHRLSTVWELSIVQELSTVYTQCEARWARTTLRWGCIKNRHLWRVTGPQLTPYSQDGRCITTQWYTISHVSTPKKKFLDWGDERHSSNTFQCFFTVLSRCFHNAFTLCFHCAFTMLLGALPCLLVFQANCVISHCCLVLAY